jgi:hypothetical protein
MWKTSRVNLKWHPPNHEISGGCGFILNWITEDGICMGFGLGLACAAEFRLVTERSLLAMPECVIGITPDVGFAATAALMTPGVGKLEFGEQRFQSCTGGSQ